MQLGALLDTKLLPGMGASISLFYIVVQSDTMGLCWRYWQLRHPSRPVATRSCSAVRLEVPLALPVVGQGAEPDKPTPSSTSIGCDIHKFWMVWVFPLTATGFVWQTHSPGGCAVFAPSRRMSAVWLVRVHSCRRSCPVCDWGRAVALVNLVGKWVGAGRKDNKNVRKISMQ